MTKRTLAQVLAAIGFFTVASLSNAATIKRLSPEGGLGKLAFKQVKMNDQGDFVAVSRTLVYIGNVGDQSLEKIAEEPKSSFVLEDFSYLNVTFQGGSQQIRTDAETCQTRLDLNRHGDFVLASNRKLFTGNARAKTWKEVTTAPETTLFQQVAINDAGQYLAISSKQIWGGSTQGATATALVPSTVGSMSILDVSSFSNNFQISTGNSLMALNQAGQFVVATTGAVYQGNLGQMQATVLLDLPRAYFQQVTLNETGEFVVVTAKDVFAGRF